MRAQRRPRRAAQQLLDGQRAAVLVQPEVGVRIDDFRARGPQMLGLGQERREGCVVDRVAHGAAHYCVWVSWQVVIAGGGFGGFYAARALERLLPPQSASVTLVNEANFLLYTPLLPGAAGAALDPRHVVVPLRSQLSCTDLMIGRVAGADPQRRALQVQRIDGEQLELGYDQLVVALGSVSRTLPIPGLAEHAIGLKSLSDATALRNRLLTCLDIAESIEHPSLRAEYLGFVFVGAGYAGVEGLAELQDFAVEAIERYRAAAHRACAGCSSRAAGGYWGRSRRAWAPSPSASCADEGSRCSPTPRWSVSTPPRRHSRGACRSLAGRSCGPPGSSPAPFSRTWGCPWTGTGASSSIRRWPSSFPAAPGAACGRSGTARRYRTRRAAAESAHRRHSTRSARAAGSPERRRHARRRRPAPLPLSHQGRRGGARAQPGGRDHARHPLARAPRMADRPHLPPAADAGHGAPAAAPARLERRASVRPRRVGARAPGEPHAAGVRRRGGGVVTG